MGPSSGEQTTGPRVLQDSVMLCSPHIEGYLDVKATCFEACTPIYGIIYVLLFLLHELSFFVCFLKSVKSLLFG